jgi:hypothetical protein
MPFGFAMETKEVTNFFGNCVNIFFVIALRQWRQIWEAMKRYSRQKIKAMKR